MTTTRLERDGGLAVLTLDNPPLNQISEQVVDDLVEVVAALEPADDVRALLVRGEGDIFSAGADVRLFAGRSAAEMRPLLERFLDLGRRVEALPFPTLAAVHGMCVAGGLELVLFLDLIWAAEGTNLGLLETRLGIVPLAGGIERVAARAGLGRARAIALSGNLFPAEQFEAWGVVDRVLSAEELQPQAEKFAKRLASGPARAFAAVKQVRGRLHRGRRRGRRRAPARGRRGPVRHGGRPERDRIVPDVGARQGNIRRALTRFERIDLALRAGCPRSADSHRRDPAAGAVVASAGPRGRYARERAGDG